MSVGIYALLSLTSGELDPRDVAAMSLNAGPLPATIQICAPGLALRIDTTCGVQGDVSRSRGSCVALLGHIDDCQHWVRELGLAGDTPPSRVAQEMFERYGTSALHRLIGEWVLLIWQDEPRRLMVAASSTRSDVVFIGTDGRTVAIAPEPRLLAQLPWIGKEFDLTGLALAMGRSSLRAMRMGRSYLRRVSVLESGCIHYLAEGSHRVEHASPPPPASPWSGSFEDAIADLGSLLHRIVKAQADRHDGLAVLLSGGLDSSTLAWLAACACGDDRKLLCLSSVAPVDSGLPDERPFIDAVARALALPVAYVTPPPDSSAYIPSSAHFDRAEFLAASPRSYLYDSLFGIASQAGATAVFDGEYGELALTRSLPGHVGWLRRSTGRLRSIWLATRVNTPDLMAFNPRVSDDVLRIVASLPPRATAGSNAVGESSTGQPVSLGDPPGLWKAALKTGHVPGFALRHLLPFRHPRLLQLVASFPPSFLARDGYSRALARALLIGKLPDVVRLRVCKLPFSPDYFLRLQRQTGHVRARLFAYRRSAARDWLDLDWLEQGLQAIETGADLSTHHCFTVQSTVTAAEFFLVHEQW